MSRIIYSEKADWAIYEIKIRDWIFEGFDYVIELNVSLGISDYAKKMVFVQTALTREQMLEHDRIPELASVMST